MQIAIAVLALVSALLVAKVQALLNENAKLREDVNKQKHETYVKLASLLKSLIDGEDIPDLDKQFNKLSNQVIFFASAKSSGNAAVIPPYELLVTLPII